MWQNDVHLTTVSSHYRSTFAPVRHRKGEVSCHKLSWRMKPGSIISNPDIHEQAVNGVVSHDNSKEEIQECCRDKVTFLWEEKGVILLKFLLRGTTVNSQRNITSSWSLNACLRQVHPTTNMSEVLLLHDSTRPCIKKALYFHHTYSCLILWKTACEDTLMWITGYCRALCTSGRKEWRRWKKTSDEDIDYSEIAMPSAMMSWSFHISNL